MGPEIWIAVAAVFVSGGAIGSAGTLLAQWILNKVEGEPPPQRAFDMTEREALRAELSDLHRHLRNMDARLDFTERLLDGALQLAPPPSRYSDEEPDGEDRPPRVVD